MHNPNLSNRMTSLSKIKHLDHNMPKPNPVRNQNMQAEIQEMQDITYGIPLVPTRSCVAPAQNPHPELLR